MEENHGRRLLRALSDVPSGGRPQQQQQQPRNESSARPPPSPPHVPGQEALLRKTSRTSPTQDSSPSPKHPSPSASVRLPSTRGVSSIHPATSSSSFSSPSASGYDSGAALHRPFLSPMDRIFIFFFEPATLNTDAWANLPSPTPSPTPSPLSPWQQPARPPPFPANRFLPAIGCFVLLLIYLLLRLLVAGHPYSGAASPPQYGDYEAQRHWMELTLHLPAVRWYWYDLQWWGLDYPPLTAYVSWLCGSALQLLGMREMLQLDSSRGYESENSKAAMRLTVIAADCLCFLPALVVFTRRYYAHHKTLTAAAISLFVASIHPAFTLIDHGHFQYNCIALGLTTAAIVALFDHRPYSAACCFCLALGFKQMTLYYAPVFFVFMLAEAAALTPPLPRGASARARVLSLLPFVRRVAALTAVVIATFSVLLLPWLLSDDPVREVGQILHRLFPVARGLYEDKVANWWCASSLLIKWPQLLPRDALVLLSIAATLLSFLPSLVHLFFFPSQLNFLYSLSITSFSFFLFSFQVHEKSVLLPLLPASLLLFAEHPLLASWLGFIGTFSLYPLMVKDRLQVVYIASQLLYCCIVGGLIGSIPLRSERKEMLLVSQEQQQQQPPPTSTAAVWTSRLASLSPSHHNAWYPYVSLLSLGSLVMAIVIHCIAQFAPLLFPSWTLWRRYPDLVSMMFVEYSFVHFLAFFLFLYALQLSNVRAAPAQQLVKLQHQHQQ